MVKAAMQDRVATKEERAKARGTLGKAKAITEKARVALMVSATTVGNMVTRGPSADS